MCGVVRSMAVDARLPVSGNAGPIFPVDTSGAVGGRNKMAAPRAGSLFFGEPRARPPELLTFLYAPRPSRIVSRCSRAPPAVSWLRPRL
jgi:hypothetical protein